VFYDFTGAPHLEGRWNAAHDEAEERIIARQPPIAVKSGDLVEIGGLLCRVRRIDRLRRTCSIDALDANGNTVGGDMGISVDGLVPIESSGAAPFPRPPDRVKDGYGRARFNLDQIKAAMRRGGRGGDD
jgi:hypothetical protein